MLFNSLEFAVFLPLVFILYWSFKDNFKLQNIIVLAASYVFYGWWDYRFLFLLAFSTFLDYFTGLRIHEANTRLNKKIWLFSSVFLNLGFLGVFKYYNFFVHSFERLLNLAGMHPDVYMLNIILPVGISFYTFHGLSYVFDIYNGKIEPTRNFVNYSVFVSFFPLLVAGPIERATHLLPQVERPRQFSYEKAVDGMRQILWGLFKKMVVADNCATIVNSIFDTSGSHSGSTLLIGAVFFTFQIYGDFSGYSDIALGTARLFGFELLRNFSFPYFSRDIAEFWRRWHISLSSWFRDYLYYPLGGSRGSMFMRIRNTFIIFLVSGFWHGASWNFVAWGALNALFFLPLLLTNKNRSNIDIVAKGKILPSLRDAISIAITFTLTVFAWIFFRSPNVYHAFNYIKTIFSKSLFTRPEHIPLDLVTFITIMMTMEWLQREKNHALEISGTTSPALRWAGYISLLIAVIGMGLFKESSFIYFQF